MRGEWELRYRYMSRTGPNDFYGSAAVAQQLDMPIITSVPIATSIGLSGPNNPYVQVEGYSSKGADASYAEERLWLYPRIKVNDAISVHTILSFSGNLNVFASSIHAERASNTGTSRGLYDGISSWNRCIGEYPRTLKGMAV